VTSVANESRDDQLRVELAVDPGSVPSIHLQHGLAGTVEVQIDRLSPAILLLRAAGQHLSTPNPGIGQFGETRQP
jgi:membrane fusion protein (multidrug efflux system)